MLYRNHEAWIAYDGVAVPELAPLIPEAGDRSFNTATAYVLSEKGKVFTIHWRHTIPNSILSVSVRLDGVLVHHHISMPGTKDGLLRGVVSGKNTIRPFVFSDVPRLQNPDFQPAHADVGSRRDFGLIRVAIVPIHYSPTTPATLLDGALGGNISPSPRSDMHCISLQEECSIDSEVGGSNSHTVSIVPPFDMQLMHEEAAMFDFRYGPLGCLQSNGVVLQRSDLGKGTVNSTPSTSIPSTLGKRSRAEFEDTSSLSAVEAASKKAPSKVIKTYITRRLVKEETAEDSVVVE